MVGRFGWRGALILGLNWLELWLVDVEGGIVRRFVGFFLGRGEQIGTQLVVGGESQLPLVLSDVSKDFSSSRSSSCSINSW